MSNTAKTTSSVIIAETTSNINTIATTNNNDKIDTLNDNNNRKKLKTLNNDEKSAVELNIKIVRRVLFMQVFYSYSSCLYFIVKGLN